MLTINAKSVTIVLWHSHCPYPRELLRISKTKDHICYGIDKLDQLHYAKGKLSALEALLQDLRDLQNREDNVDDIDQT